jgi:SAM-dependent methyltransferase
VSGTAVGALTPLALAKQIDEQGIFGANKMSGATQAADTKRLAAARELWNEASETFDDSPDHGLRISEVRAAWAALLRAALPPSPCTVLDIGCGTGSLSTVLVELGYSVTGIDIAPAMIAKAEHKARALHQTISFQIMDAAKPDFAPQSFDTVLCRHLLWTLPAIDQVLERWAHLLKPCGVLLLIEGRWHTGAGLRPEEVVAALPESLMNVAVQPLSDRVELWGSLVNDERYAIRAEKSI